MPHNNYDTHIRAVFSSASGVSHRADESTGDALHMENYSMETTITEAPQASNRSGDAHAHMPEGGLGWTDHFDLLRGRTDRLRRECSGNAALTLYAARELLPILDWFAENKYDSDNQHHRARASALRILLNRVSAEGNTVVKEVAALDDTYVAMLAL